MKNFMLGISLIGNAFLGYKLIEKNGLLDEWKNRTNAMKDSLEGQLNQEVGQITDDPSQEAKGMIQEGAGNAKSKFEDVKQDLKS